MTLHPTTCFQNMTACLALVMAAILSTNLMADDDSLWLEIGVSDDDSSCDGVDETYATMLPRSKLQTNAYAQRSRRVVTEESDDTYLISVKNTGQGGGILAPHSRGPLSARPLPDRAGKSRRGRLSLRPGIHASRRFRLRPEKLQSRRSETRRRSGLVGADFRRTLAHAVAAAKGGKKDLTAASRGRIVN